MSVEKQVVLGPCFTQAQLLFPTTPPSAWGKNQAGRPSSLPLKWSWLPASTSQASYKAVPVMPCTTLAGRSPLTQRTVYKLLCAWSLPGWAWTHCIPLTWGLRENGDSFWAFVPTFS